MIDQREIGGTGFSRSLARIGILVVSDRASRGEYKDQGEEAINSFLAKTIRSNWITIVKIIPDGVESVAGALIEMSDRETCDLILTTGGTGPAPRDLTPEATRSVITRELAGFGELMRRVSLEQVPTAILSRQTAGTRGQCLIVNLPGRPSSIDICLGAVFPAIPYCLDLIGARPIEVNQDVCRAFRPDA
ncbi:MULTISPECIES: molybdopterin adenylyltransferase [unclassified Bradyrhizobium]|uniref:molybdopterin adenylyltransferase n=1 Tax=unclassified Bradyrhizobium TaxID=2631580 RepID=UPI001BABFD5F|nr:MULTISPECIES: molybdopterin adenylyltransferase [unclassified Bradyrhizobium]MBR1203686.1 molybdopterin adenylyltransferase [Bradyrhizobium sp. AUGA SZCCT0124]MBR1310427.1 molybdopterin adenylyltransferase [Bradyrhizobium sp. AUGA SZCCT0051]MBR1340570.1 molybdopterin adenylyltransferase [Bradyrhizobium sp. AUGA SZCCT0105]MBR1355176.1 molybdopterin adenylyltransferase [Bradyrhizobium sp. AUGA SZCCT0045]